MTNTTQAPTTCRLPKPSYVGLPADEITIIEGHNDRQAFDEQPLTLLGESIDAIGQVQDVVINMNHATGQYELIDGERRVREKLRRIEQATVSGSEPPATERMIQCKVYEDLTPLQVFMASDVTDTHKVKLNVIERANKFEKMAVKFDFTNPQIAEHEGVTAETVSRLRGLLKLPDEIQQMTVRSKNPLPVHQARLLLKLPQAEQLPLAQRAAPLDGPILSEAEVRKLVQTSIGPPLPGMGEPSKPPAASGTQSPPPTTPGDSPPATPTSAAVQRKPLATPPPDFSIPKKTDIIEVADSIRSVKCVISIVGKLSASKKTGAIIKAAVVTLKVGDAVAILPEALDLTHCPGLGEAVEAATKAQVAKAKAAKKITKKNAKKKAKK